ncbi:MAG: glycosyltransferase family 4 protein [Calditrichaceae bacterium]|nr:glycosyltransferase family 4 protein [Calditrichaceae bacterium]
MDLVYNYSDYGIVLGKNLISMVSKWFDEKKIFVIPNGTDFFVDISKRKKDFSEINIGYIGFLGPEKGTYELLNIFEELSTEYSDIKLILAGEFAYGNIEFKEDFLKKIATSKYKHNIILSGKIIDKQKQDFFLNTDIFAFPSWIEGHPNVILEAMAASCPIVASDVGAVSESVLDGYNGFLVPAREEGKFKVKLSELIKNEELRKKMGENSFLLYKEKFTSDINIDKIINAFQIAGTEQCV